MTVTQKLYHNCFKKHDARLATIIEPYRLLYGESLPKEKQYWTMCAECADGKGIINGSELHQITSSGLIQPEQFHGVDMNPEIIHTNKLYQKSHWYNDDFLRAMEKAFHDGNFDPHIVNADLLNMPMKAANFIANILDFLYAAKQTDTMLVANVVLKSHNRFANANDLCAHLQENTTFRIVWSKKNWTIFAGKSYEYNGTDNYGPNDALLKNPKTIMGTVVFVPRHRIKI
jgi:hypothetical protein